MVLFEVLATLWFHIEISGAVCHTAEEHSEAYSQ